MDRVAFLIEASNQRIDCLLNPENLVIQRQAGVRARRSASGQVAGPGLGEDPLLFTGGGRTQFDLDLLFDVDLSGSSIRVKDVRELTRPLQQLAENSAQDQNPRRLPLVRFVWGKTWNIPGYVTALVERLEAFTPEGVPQRSWLRLRFLRADEAPKESAQGTSFPSLAGISLDAGRSSTVPVKTTTLTGGPAVDEISPGTPSVSQAVVQAADIFGDALANTSTMQSIMRFQARAGSLIGQAASILSGWAGSAGSALAGFVQSAVEGIARRIQALSDPPPSAMIQRISDLAGEVQAAAGAVLSRLEAAAGRAEKELARLLGPIFRDIQQVMAALGVSAAIVARAVKAQAVQTLATAYRKIGVMAEAIRQAVKDLPENIAGLFHRGLDLISGVLDQVRQTGQMVLFRQIPAALGQMVSGIEQLWAAGSHAAVKVIQKAVEGIALGLKAAYAAAEAAGAVLKQGAIHLALAGRDQLLAAIDAMKKNKDAAQNLPALEGFARLQGIVLLLQGDDQVHLPLDAVENIQAALKDLAPGQEDAVTAKIQPELERLNQAFEAVQADEEKTLQEQVIASLSADVPQGMPGALKSSAPGRKVGERLDQVALEYYGDPALWRLLALYNDIQDIFHVPAGRALSIPPVTILEHK